MRIALNAQRRVSFQTPALPLPLPLPSLLPTLGVIKFRNINSILRFKSLGFSHRLRAMSTATADSPPSVQVRDNIDLTDKERQIFERLLQVVRHYTLQTQLRVAGGWVRDKLLGKECYDIDIAIDNMLGREFCEKVNEYLSSTGEKAQGIGVIQCNPDQSKHLETARMRLFDMWIDFVNLRSEDYSAHSRIPTMRFGTAEEDAYRRDLTINSLFYNINTSSVEDFTGRGIADLKYGKIVTPLPPKETFLDDPLRVLRAIRFGARFGFTLVDDLKKAAFDDDVKAAISDKISRERVGHEIDLMVSGNQPVKATTYISDLLLFWVVFGLPSAVDPPTSQGCESCERICVAYMDGAWNLMQLIGSSIFNDEQRRLALYAALFLPLRNTIYKDNKSKKVPVVNYIFRNSLKLKASDAETVINVHNATKKFVSLIPFILSTNEDVAITEVDWGSGDLDVPVASKLRILAGLLLREIKDFWRVALLASMLLYPMSIDGPKDPSAEQFSLEKRAESFKVIENAIIKLGLEKVWEMKPLVNGKEIMSVLQLITGGPLVREWQQKLLEWQLAHPSGTSEECLDWLKQTYAKRARME
ncbi:CCA tRNA nucleotidyltransferase [Actinidia chinensis var. chinensis]|uniref:CCA tRNA nucleotidyltransferase n=1 Tax=Actinidia chinensis var. chinensis TaxID=1590841 RepID=A0A2R6RP77_ACTCC|nr:CCA tRNA nucleotidyltransferase [Actinidia chinensis var. chinensis]